MGDDQKIQLAGQLCTALRDTKQHLACLRSMAVLYADSMAKFSNRLRDSRG